MPELPEVESVRRGVDEWTAGALITGAEVVRNLTTDAKLTGPWFAEELLVPDVGESALPSDIKIYAFYGQVGYGFARRAPLHQDVAERRRLDGAGEHGNAGAIGGALAQQRVLRAASDEVDGAHVNAAEAACGCSGIRERLRERFDDAAGELRSGAGRGDAVLLAP